MTTTQIVDVDFSRPGWETNVFAVTGDVYSRFIEVHLYSNGQPYTPPEGTTCQIIWQRGSACGAYSEIATGTQSQQSTHPAWQLDGNVVTIELNWQIAQQTGPVGVNVALLGADGGRLQTWQMLCQVQPSPVVTADSADLPSESATQAANRAEAAAAEAEASAQRAAASEPAGAAERAETAAQEAQTAQQAAVASQTAAAQSAAQAGQQAQTAQQQAAAAAASAQQAQAAAGSINTSLILPAGTVYYFALQEPPAGYLVCNGAAVSRTTYANLFQAIGTRFGAGDGSTTFNLPDLRGTAGGG